MDQHASKSSPIVSIILPTYNRAELLHHAIRSILRQTYANFELIIVDDHSSDKTPEVVQQFSDSRIRYLRNEVNLKLPRTLNKGFAQSQGDYLTWTSDDNLYAPNAIETMLRYAQQHDCHFVFADYFHFSELDSNTHTPLDTQHVKLPDRLALANCNQVGACFLYSRQVYEKVGDYDPELFLIEDYDFFIRVSKSFEMRHINEPLYYFRRHGDSLYCSRFFEVKASDLLVRYKNGLLGKDEVVHATLNLMLANLNMLKSNAAKQVVTVLEKTSYRLAQRYKQALRWYLSGRLSPKIGKLLDRYDQQANSFREVRDELVDVMRNYILLEYRH